MIEAFTSDLVRRVTKLTSAQMLRLERLGVVGPSVAPREPGWPPLYSFEDVVRFRVAAELLRLDMNAPEIRDLVAELERRGHENPLVAIRFVGDQVDDRERELPRGVRKGRRRWRGRAFVIDPETDQAMSAHHLDQPANVYDLPLQDLRSRLVGTIEDMTRRQATGSVEKVRGVQGGQPVVVGTRIPTRLVAKLDAAGWSRDRIRESYPILTDEDIAAALAHERGRKRRTAA